MPNYCNYSMKIKGKEENVNKLISYLNADYHYSSHMVGETKMYRLEDCTEEKHFFRVFSAVEEELYEEKFGNDTVAKVVSGDCAWSVSVCMFPGFMSYYNSWTEKRDAVTGKSNKDLCDDFRGTNMLEATKELGLVVEIFSEEGGCEFMEHYLIDNGETIEEECVEWRELHDDDGEPILDENGDIMTEGGLDWEFSI